MPEIETYRGGASVLTRALQQAGLRPFSSRGVLLAIGVFWFALALTTVLWTWGLNPLVFPSSDEAVVRYAALLVAKGSGPFLSLPYPDPEDLMHPRSWISLGSNATPTYAPVSFYVYGWLTRLHDLGLLLVMAWPASAVGAFAAGVGRLLPVGRRWLGIFAPALAFPALYWILRPWMNISPLLISICWTLLFWAHWRDTGKRGYLAVALFSLGYGAAVRPDYAAYLFVLVLLFSVAARPEQWKLIGTLVISSGVLALGANLVLNRVITGHALQAAYQLAIDRTWGPEPAHGIPGLGMLRSLLLPMGLPSWAVGSNEFRKYWLTMGPIWALLLCQLALLPIFWKSARLPRSLHLLALLIIVVFALSRMHNDLWGGTAALGEVHHSVPRYLSPVYLLAALPPLLFVGRCQRRALWIPLTGLLMVLGVSGCYEIAVHQGSSFSFVRGFVQGKTALLDTLARKVPEDATVYTAKEDKWLWSRWRVWITEEPEASAISIERAVRAQLKVFLLEPSRTDQFKRVSAQLARRNIKLTKLDGRRGLYRVDALAPVPPEK